MNLYLVRHGQAVLKEVDADQPLSDAGRAGVERVASALRAGGVRVGRVLHSGKARARQTAEIIGQAVLPGQGAEEIDGIAPLDPTDGLAETVASWTEDTMVVGHLPFMDKMVARLVTGGEEQPALVVFSPATVVCLQRDEGGQRWRIDWVIKPEVPGAAT